MWLIKVIEEFSSLPWLWTVNSADKDRTIILYYFIYYIVLYVLYIIYNEAELVLLFHRAKQWQSTERASGGVVVQPGGVQEGTAREIWTRYKVIAAEIKPCFGKQRLWSYCRRLNESKRIEIFDWYWMFETVIIVWYSCCKAVRE